jgi:hypothetical protein
VVFWGWLEIHDTLGVIPAKGFPQVSRGQRGTVIEVTRLAVP